MIKIILLKNTEEAFSAGNINSPTLGIIKNIIGISGNIQIGNRSARFRVKNHELRRLARPDEQTVMLFVQRHWKIGFGIGDWPGRGYDTFFPIHRDYFLGRRNVYKDTRARLL